MATIAELVRDPLFLNADPARRKKVFDAVAAQDQEWNSAPDEIKQKVYTKYLQEVTTPTQPSPVAEESGGVGQHLKQVVGSLVGGAGRFTGAVGSAAMAVPSIIGKALGMKGKTPSETLYEAPTKFAESIKKAIGTPEELPPTTNEQLFESVPGFIKTGARWAEKTAVETLPYAFTGAIGKGAPTAMRLLAEAGLFGGLTTGEEIGRGKPIGEALKAGATTAVGVGAMGAVLNKLIRRGVDP